MKELEPPVWLKPIVWLMAKVAGLMSFKQEKGYRFPNGIPRKPYWMVLSETRLTDREIDEIHRQLWNGREHG